MEPDLELQTEPALEPVKPVINSDDNPLLIPDEDLNNDEVLEKKLKDLMFNFYVELENLKKGSTDLSKLEEIIGTLLSLKGENSGLIESYVLIINQKLSELQKDNNLKYSKEELEEYIASHLKIESPFKISFEDINLENIVECYERLNEAIASGDLKAITVARGRLIKKLQYNKKAIDAEYAKVESLVKLAKLLEKENPSIEEIKSLVDNDEILKLCFSKNFASFEDFKLAFQNLYNNLEVQQIIFLNDALAKELKKHDSVLNERYSKEFLDKKGNLASLVTVLPNAVSLSIQKLCNSIRELKESKTKRQKMARVGNIMKDSLKVLGTPVIYAGKFAISNWYSLYMAYQTISGIKQTKLEQEQKAKEEAEAKAREEERAKREAERLKHEEEVKAKLEAEEEARKAAEAKAKAEEAARQQKEEELRKAQELREEARRKAQEDARRKAEEARLTSEQNATNAQENTNPEASPEPEAEASPEKAPEDNTPVPDPVPDPNMNNPYPNAKILTISPPSPAFDGNIERQLVYGIIDPDTKLSVRISIPGDDFIHALFGRKVPLSCRELQAFFNWSPETDLDNYTSPYNELGDAMVNSMYTSPYGRR